MHEHGRENAVTYLLTPVDTKSPVMHFKKNVKWLSQLFLLHDGFIFIEKKIIPVVNT